MTSARPFRTALQNFAETMLLLAALLATLPYVPSHEIATLPLFPGGALALLCFGGSRFLRWKKLSALIAVELLGFGLFIWVANGVANLLYRTG